MSPPHKSAVFLERRAYQKRRMRDLARGVPVFGAVLWSIPLLWQQGDAGGQGTQNSAAVVYIFVVWIILIVLAALISRAVRSDREQPPDVKNG